MASSALRIRNPRGELVEAEQFTASDAKNGFGRLLDHVIRDGGVAITKHSEPFAVVISIESYHRLVGAQEGALQTLTEEFDALLDSMQAPGSAAAMQRAFDMTPEALGRAALGDAARARPTAPRKRVAAKMKRHARGQR